MHRVRWLVPAVVALALAPAAARAGGVTWTRCGVARERCAHLDVPLDRSGAVPGRLRLALARLAPHKGPSRGTILVLAGGPGQASAALLPEFADDLRPVIAHRTLLAFDARGVGRSTRLRCGFPTSAQSFTTAIAACARELGPRRAFYSTADTVADMESVRAALGIPRLTVYGVSYGTEPALGYAREHPDRVDRIVLDSTPPLGGSSALGLDRVAAMRGLLARMCAARCPELSPLADATALLRRLPVRPHGRSTFGRLTRRQGEIVLYTALLASDLHPFVKASIPAALHLAARGRLGAFGRLSMLASESELSDPRVPRLRPLASIAALPRWDPIPVVTDCEDIAFPWASGDVLGVRKAKLRAAVAAVPAAAIAPFSRATVAEMSQAHGCLAWPEAGDAPRQLTAPLPGVPALVLGGQDDIRTPAASARNLADALPGATLVVVPHQGHSVVSAAEGHCPADALRAFFAGRPVARCAPLPADPVDPVPPGLGDLGPVHGVPGLAGEVLRAAILTLHHDVGLLPPDYASVFPFAFGTQGGRVRLRWHRARWTARLERLCYVRGVTVSGRLHWNRHLEATAGLVRVSLRGRPFGRIATLPDGSIRGRIGGRRFHLGWRLRLRLNNQSGVLWLPFG